MQFIPIRTFDTYINANLLQGRLENEGIICYLQNEFSVTIDPFLTNAIGGIQLCVNKDQIERALELVNAFDEQDNLQ